MPKFRSMSIAETLLDKEARDSFALATGFSLEHEADRDGEKAARRARYERRRHQGRTQRDAR